MSSFSPLAMIDVAPAAFQVSPLPDETSKEESQAHALLLTDATASRALRDAVGRYLPAGWGVEETGRFERALFLLSFDAWGMVVVDESFCGPADHEGLAWLSGRARAPVVLLSDSPPEIPPDGFPRAGCQWLPRTPALALPGLLAAALKQAARWREWTQRGGETVQAPGTDHRQVTRLVNLLWEVIPWEPRLRWFSQRYMLERLHEEVAHAERHCNPLAVVLAEAREVGTEEGPDSLAWVAERVLRTKRLCDVAGQYGPSGFMLLLHATAAGATVCCRRLQALLEQPPPEAAEPCPLRFSVAASVHTAGDTPRSLLCRAERNLALADAEPPGKRRTAI